MSEDFPATRTRITRAGSTVAPGWPIRLRAQFDLLGNTVSLLGTTMVTSILGIAYWWVAARFLPLSSVGYGSAALSAMTLLGNVGMLGFGTLLMGRMAAGVRSGSAGSLVATGLLAAGAASAVLGLAFGVAIPRITSSFAPYASGLPETVLFAAAVSLTSVALVLDNALVGLFLPSLQFSRNLAFSILKLLVLVAVASRLPDSRGLGIIFSWSVGILLSFGVVAVLLGRRGRRVLHAPRLTALRASARSALLHHWLNLSVYAPRIALPLLITALLSARSSGAFYPAWLITSMVYILPTHLSTSLFAVGSSDPSAIPGKTRFALKTAMLIGIPASAVCALGAHLLLRIFGGTYAAAAAVPLQVLMLGYFPNIFRFHYVAVQRFHDRMRQAATVMTVFVVLELGCAAVGARVDGLTGLAVALTGAMWIEMLITAGPVVRACRTGAHAFAHLR